MMFTRHTKKERKDFLSILIELQFSVDRKLSMITSVHKDTVLLPHLQWYNKLITNLSMITSVHKDTLLLPHLQWYNKLITNL